MNTPSSSNSVKDSSTSVRMIPLPDLSKLPVLKPGSKLHNIKTSSHDKATNRSHSNQHELVRNQDSSSSFSNLNPRLQANQPVDTPVSTFAMLNKEDNDVSLKHQEADASKSQSQSSAPNQSAAVVVNPTTNPIVISTTKSNSVSNSSSVHTNGNHNSVSSVNNANTNSVSPKITTASNSVNTQNSNSSTSNNTPNNNTTTNSSLLANPDLIEPIMAFDKAFADLEQVQNSFIYNVTKTEDDFLTRYNQGHLDLPVFDQDVSEEESTTSTNTNIDSNAVTTNNVGNTESGVTTNTVSSIVTATNPTNSVVTTNNSNDQDVTANVNPNLTNSALNSNGNQNASSSVNVNIPVNVNIEQSTNPAVATTRYVPSSTHSIPPLAYQSANDLADDDLDIESDLAINDLADFDHMIDQDLDHSLLGSNPYQSVSPVNPTVVISNLDEQASGVISDSSAVNTVTPSPMSTAQDNQTTNATTASQYEVIVETTTTNSEPTTTEPTVANTPEETTSSTETVEPVAPVVTTTDVEAEATPVVGDSVAVASPSVFASSIEHKEENYDYSRNRVASFFGVLAFIGVVGLVGYLAYVLFNLIW